MDALPFQSLYRHGFVRVAVATPAVRVADPVANLEATLALARAAVEEHARLVVFPELGLSAYSNEDLFLQDALLAAVETAVDRLIEASGSLPGLLVVGAPIVSEARLFNCALVVSRGSLLGVVPKSFLPSYREFYEKRQFSPASAARESEIVVAGRRAPFGPDLVFEADDVRGFALHVEICEDLWVPIPPSSRAALAGATVLANLSASDVTIAKAEYRRLLCASQSGRCVAAYLYAAAGPGESTTDLAWDGHALVYENGELLAEGERFPTRPRVVVADVDLDRLRLERIRLTSFNDQAEREADALRALRRIRVRLEPPSVPVPLRREVPRFPFVPGDPGVLDERCREAFEIQVQGLATRLRSSGIERVVVGFSGGLDSTHAALVASRALSRLGLPPANLLGVTLPGPGTTEPSRLRAHALMKALGATAREIDLARAVQLELEDLAHPAARGEPRYDVTFENVQAGQRASRLFRLANFHRGLLVGTSDLSELALGFTTYGVGDHMSHYAVNASVPKTLIQHLVRWAARSGEFGDEVAAVLAEIAEAPFSPELLPPESDGGQHAEATVGPYELQDFHLYWISRYGCRPSKVLFLAAEAWGDAARGHWPPTIPAEARRAYDLATIARWLAVFLERFFASSQFKRSALPNGPKIGSGGSLSPRSDWRAPSDASAAPWLDELRTVRRELGLG
ncbi:MAG TPA: NAD(+) synthase [Myxococcota bacterium]|jgi:NAD+ synthase (glutamine-hydrolysing)|nr:NAD(+) synthase [Myxococcota bacterium]